MNELVGIKQTELFDIRQTNGMIAHGASQQWYPKFNQRMAGCGPTVASMQMYYLSQTRESLRALCPDTRPEQENFTELMTEMLRFVTPGMRGVHRTSIYADGIQHYAREHGFLLKPRVLDISHDVALRPNQEEVAAFLEDSFREDIPVAFFNLSNVAVHNLEQWHWVLLTGFLSRDLRCSMLDQGKQAAVELSLWLFTNTLGGGFVGLDLVR